MSPVTSGAVHPTVCREAKDDSTLSKPNMEEDSVGSQAHDGGRLLAALSPEVGLASRSFLLTICS